MAGVGLLNKPSMTFFLVALGLGLLVTPQRKILFTRWAALAVALLLLIALPNVLWQIHNHWPTLEFLENGRLLSQKRHSRSHSVSSLRSSPRCSRSTRCFGSLAWWRFCAENRFAMARWLGSATMLFFYAIMFAAARQRLLPRRHLYQAFFAAGAIAWEHRFRDTTRVREQRLVGFPIFTTPFCSS